MNMINFSSKALTYFMSFCAIVVASSACAQDSGLADLKARQAYMIEAKTGTILLAKNENQSFPPASLAKLMTMDLVFEALRNGEIRADQTYRVSENAWRTGGAPSGTTTMFAALKSEVPVIDLIHGVMIQNANDACIILAEGMSGNEAAFAERMTARARDLGLTRTVYGNSTGLPEQESRTTARDLVELARHIQTHYPDFYALYTQPDFTWNKIFQRNKNPLLGLDIGVDGLGAGYAEGAGYAVVASVQRNGTRLFMALGGLASDKERQEESRRVLEWGLSSFETRLLFKPDEVIGQAAVYGGLKSHIDLVAAEPVDVYVRAKNGERLSGKIVYHWPLRAPVQKGQVVGTLVISEGDRELKQVPLQANEDVGVGGLVSKATDAALELLLFWL